MSPPPLHHQPSQVLHHRASSPPGHSQPLQVDLWRESLPQVVLEEHQQEQEQVEQTQEHPVVLLMWGQG